MEVVYTPGNAAAAQKNREVRGHPRFHDVTGRKTSRNHPGCTQHGQGIVGYAILIHVLYLLVYDCAVSVADSWRGCQRPTVPDLCTAPGHRRRAPSPVLRACSGAALREAVHDGVEVFVATATHVHDDDLVAAHGRGAFDDFGDGVTGFEGRDDPF